MFQLLEDTLHKIGKRSFIILSIIIVVAALLRIVPQLDKVFVDGAVLFRGVDPWYHMRLVDVMAVQFPAILSWDPYAMFPVGAGVGFHPLIAWTVSAAGIVGLNYEVVGAFLPPVFGGLIIIPIFFLTRELFPKSTLIPLVASLFVAFIPSELMHRSLLGFTDNHIIETFLATCILLFFVLAVKRNWRFFIGAGVSIGLLSLNWHGTPFILLIIGIWFLISFLSKTKRGEDTLLLVKIVGFASLIGFGMMLPLKNLYGMYYTFAVFGLLTIGPWLLQLVKSYWKWSNKSFLIFVLSTIAVITAVAHPYIDVKSAFQSVFWSAGTTIGEAMPLSPSVAMSVYGVPIFLMGAGLVFYLRRNRNTLFTTWTTILLIAAMCQVRWGYYFIIPVAILSAYMIALTKEWVAGHAKVAVVTVLLIFSIIPSIKGIVGVTSLPNNITPQWYNALVWMRYNTPEPYGDPNAYYQLSIDNEPTYSVLSWWDYGHWITRIGRRVPLCSPAYQEEKGPINFFASTSVEDAHSILDKNSTRYIIYDKDVIAGKFYAIEAKAGKSVSAKDSIAYRLWFGEVPGITLVHNEGDVKVFEYEK